MKTQSKKASMCARSRDGRAWIEVEAGTPSEAERIHSIYASAPQLLKALEAAEEKLEKTSCEESRRKISLSAAVRRLENLKNRLNASAFPEVASNGLPSREDIFNIHREMLSIIGSLGAEVHILPTR